MVEIIIHSCNKRLWYVKERIIPTLLEQGFPKEKIHIWNDVNNMGCLRSFLLSAVHCSYDFPNCVGFWHLQDDVLLSKDFVKRITSGEFDYTIVNNGYVCKQFNPAEVGCVGVQDVAKYWMSFPCVYIPNEVLKGFVKWFEREVIGVGKYKKYYEANKYDDFFFWTYMKSERKCSIINNVKPNLVNHIDYLLGGSQINLHHQKKTLAYYWDEEIPEHL